MDYTKRCIFTQTPLPIEILISIPGWSEGIVLLYSNTVVPAFEDHPFSEKNMVLKLTVVIKWRDIYIENIVVVGLKIEGSLEM